MNYALYVVTDPELGNGLSHSQIPELACKGGADVIQLRDKDADDVEFARYAREMKRICDRYGTTFIVNDRLDIAIAVEADGAHLGQDDMTIEEARSKVPEGFILGCSAQTLEEALKAERDGADYIGFTVFGTPTKTDAEGHGLEALALVKEKVSIPVVAIGGIKKHNAEEVIAAGADGIAVVTAVISQEDVSGAASELREIAVRALKARR